MPGGNFYKRAPLIRTDGERVSLRDLAPGNAICALGQEIMITDADVFTREYFRRELNLILAPSMDRPEVAREDLGAFYATGLGGAHPAARTTSHGTRSTDYLIKKEAINKTQKFLSYDGRTLRFVCIDEASVLPDSQNFSPDVIKTTPGVRKYILSYFLSDNSIDVKTMPVHGPGGGNHEENRQLMKKSRIAKNWKEVQRGFEPIYFDPVDFICGATLEIYGRRFFIMSCDAFSRSMYEEMDMEQPVITVLVDEEERIEHHIPQLGDGFLPIGGLEDTLATCYGMPKPAKDVKKIQRNQNRYLRCKANILTDDTIESSRMFLITFYLEDDTLQVYEEARRNSGIWGGTYLKKGRYLNDLPPDSSEPRFFKPTDIYLGNVIALNGHNFQLTEMDNMSLKFCETYPDEFPMFDTFKIVHSLISRMISLKLDLRRSASGRDVRKAGWLDRDTFVHTLDSLGVSECLNDQEMLTLLRRFKDGDKYWYMEMCDLFSHVFAASKSSIHSVRQLSTQSLNDIGAWLRSARQRTTQWRRTLRLLHNTHNGKITLDALCKVFKKHGFLFTDVSKKLLFDGYSLPANQAAQVLKELAKTAREESVDAVKKAVPKMGKAASTTRLDIRSQSRLDSSMLSMDSTTEDMGYTLIQHKRQQLMTSVLRKKGEVVNDDVSSAGYQKLSESKIVIDYNKLCDDIYVCDWV